MKLWLLRHAEAKPVGGAGVTHDAKRPLTARGQRRARLMGEMLARLDAKPCAIASSPLLRARETADLVRAALGITPPVALLPELEPDGPPEAAWKALEPLLGGDLLLVGHLPSLEVLAGWLLSPHHPPAVHLRKTAAVELLFDGPAKPGHATLEWLVSPALVETLRSR
jgi:phosphohistidine phosphatase